MIIIINPSINNKPEEHQPQHGVNKPNKPIILLAQRINKTRE